MKGSHPTVPLVAAACQWLASGPPLPTRPPLACLLASKLFEMMNNCLSSLSTAKHPRRRQSHQRPQHNN